MIDVKIDYAADDSCMIQLWAKGHHAPSEFLPACEEALRKWDEREARHRPLCYAVFERTGNGN